MGHPLVKVLDAVDLVGCVDGERNAIQALAAHDAGEALRVVRLAGGPEDALQDRLLTHGALLERVQVVLLAEGLAVDRVEGLALQVDLALAAGEALDVVDLVHGRAARVLAHDPAAALDAVPEVVAAQVVARRVGGLVVVLLGRHHATAVGQHRRRAADTVAATTGHAVVLRRRVDGRGGRRGVVGRVGGVSAATAPSSSALELVWLRTRVDGLIDGLVVGVHGLVVVVVVMVVSIGDYGLLGHSLHR